MKTPSQQEQFYTIKWENYPKQSANPNLYSQQQTNYHFSSKYPTNKNPLQIKTFMPNNKQAQIDELQSQNMSQYIQPQQQLVIQNFLIQKFIPKNILNNQPQQSHSEINNQKIRLNLRSQLIRKPRKYQISTNNAHKKYINCLKNLFYQALSQQQIYQFQQRYIKLKNSRVFFFIILVYIKYRFSQQLSQAVKNGFETQMNQKIKQYYQQIIKSDDSQLKNYRHQEIHQITIALKSIGQFYLKNTPLAIEYLYRKDKDIIIKQNHFRASLKLIENLEKQFSLIQQPKITQPYRKSYKIAKKSQQKPKSIHQNLQPDKKINNQMPLQFQDSTQLQQSSQNKFISPIRNIEKISQDDQESDQESIESIHQQNSQSEKLNQEQNSSNSSNSSQKSNQNQRIIDSQTEKYKQNQESHISDIIFPPIPPHFYLPNFDQKYGHLFRRLLYIKSWRQLNQRFQTEDYDHNKRAIRKGNQFVPSPLFFGQQNSFFERKN